MAVQHPLVEVVILVVKVVHPWREAAANSSVMAAGEEVAAEA